MTKHIKVESDLLEILELTLTSLHYLPPRLKNGLPLRDDYRIRPKSDALIIRVVTEMDAGNYTIVLTNKKTKEDQRRSFQLLVNGTFILYPIQYRDDL